MKHHPVFVAVPLAAILLAALPVTPSRGGEGPAIEAHVVAVEDVCAWPNLTLLPDGTIAAVLFNQPTHGTSEGDIECWTSRDGLSWEKRSTITKHEPDTIRMNHAAGLARNGDFVVLCSGWTNRKQPGRPKQKPFRDAILSPWVMRSRDGGRTWEARKSFPTAEPGWTEYIPFGDIWAGDDGALHTSCYQGNYRDPGTRRAWHFRSEDDGRTWKPVSVIGPRHNETSLLPLGGGEWLAAARIDRVDLFRSSDGGDTWGEPLPVTERNELNGHLSRLADGRILLSYGVRRADRRGVCVRFSEDEGRSWGQSHWLADADPAADCGYPSSVQRADGSIVTAWYASRSPLRDGYHMGATVWRAPAPDTEKP